MDYHGADSKLYMLTAIKNLLRWHLPRSSGQVRKWKLLQSSILVESGQGVVLAREFVKKVIEGMSSLQNTRQQSGSERIDIITSVAVTLGMENHNGIK